MGRRRRLARAPGQHGFRGGAEGGVGAVARGGRWNPGAVGRRAPAPRGPPPPPPPHALTCPQTPNGSPVNLPLHLSYEKGYHSHTLVLHQSNKFICPGKGAHPRVGLKGKPVQIRCGPATVKGSRGAYPLSRRLGKGVVGVEPEPGDLPFLRTPLNLRSIGRCCARLRRRAVQSSGTFRIPRGAFFAGQTGRCASCRRGCC
ncbi:hypothetical protein SAMN05421543_11079 [Alicyclobacillus macrosporangiidus]|uniref:Uncharacterized protein n=1 Tax=Alicyclobacillus macrosporangiidus TaxID=392015 RepID=A0A1I7JJI8_9BACL|nr:hypothetical protein SAMN05421543_11079 [Alicyclobacillus macrosporangiidus]